MTDKKKYPYWLAVEESKTVRFSDLAYLMADAMHPGEAEINARGAAMVNLERELKEAVRDGVLMVRNPAGLGRHTFPIGDALQRAVFIPDRDLGPFLAERGIELRLTPHGSGPIYWTLENAAGALQEQEGWHNGTRGTFQDQLKEAAQRGEVVVLDPQTCLPTLSKDVRTYWEYVTPANVNAWLDKLGAPYRWRADYDTQYAKAWEDLDKKDALEKELRLWESTPHSGVAELERKEEKIAALTASINALTASVFPQESKAAPPEQKSTAPTGTATVWTPERKEQARVTQSKYKAAGIRDFAARTAKEFGVTASRLNAVLNEKKSKKFVKKAGFWGE